MSEIAALHAQLKPAETLFVVDAMQGQDAVNVARVFNETLPLTGVILTKLDGDARGGAALSVRHVTGKPIKFVGVGEKLAALEPFHPERMASRILGMGDIVSLVEEARKGVDQEAAIELAEKMQQGQGLRPRRFQDADHTDAQDGRHVGAAGQAAGPAGRTGEPRADAGRQADSAHRGHHQFDDRAGARASGPAQGVAESAASPPAPACRFRKSTACSSSSSRCRK